MITDEADVLRDEGEAYGRKLRQAGVDVTAVRYEGVFHDFMMLNALAETNANREATRQTAQALKAALLAQSYVDGLDQPWLWSSSLPFPPGKHHRRAASAESATFASPIEIPA